MHVSSKSKRCRDFPVKQPVFIYSGHPINSGQHVPCAAPPPSPNRQPASPRPDSHAWLTLRTLFPTCGATACAYSPRSAA